MTSRKLLLLDINGVLCTKTTDADLIAQYDAANIIKLKTYTILLRPGVRKFIGQCFDEFDVGFFSSTTWRNASAILDAILAPEQRKKCVLMWFRDRTKLDPRWGKDSTIQAHDTIKLLSDVWQCPTINEARKYGPHNTIMCDDSEAKHIYNPTQCIICAKKFSGESEDMALIELLDVIRARFAANATPVNDLATNMRKLKIGEPCDEKK
jgi:hypothetical protein